MPIRHGRPPCPPFTSRRWRVKSRVAGTSLDEPGHDVRGRTRAMTGWGDSESALPPTGIRTHRFDTRDPIVRRHHPPVPPRFAAPAQRAGEIRRTFFVEGAP